MENDKDPYRLDKTSFQAMTVQEADDYQRDYRIYSVEKRLEIALYLTSMAYQFDFHNPPRMDKTMFQTEKFK